MSNELVPFSTDAFTTHDLVTTDEELNALDVVKSKSRFLPRLVLAASSSDLVKNQKCMPGQWVIPNGDDCTVLGNEVDILPIAVRNKAIDFSDRKNIITSYDKDSAEYARIKEMKKQAGWGLSFLVLERSTGELYELFFGNASGREESPNLKPFLGRADRPPRVANIKSKLVEGREFSWHVPVITKCSEPITKGPDMGTLVEEKQKFLNPKTDEVEVEEGTSTRAR